MRRRADVDAMTVPGLHAALRSDGSGGPVDTTAVELTLAGVELSPLVEWTVLHRVRAPRPVTRAPDDTVEVIERHPPVRRPVWPDDEEEW